MSQLRFFIRRTLLTVVLIFLVITALFFFFRLMPGDFTVILARGGADPETIQAMQEKWGLNDPLYVQYIRYMANLLTGDAGTSFRYNTPVWELVSTRILYSFVLVGPAVTAAYVVGSLLGAAMGRLRDTTFEKVGLLSVVTMGTIPVFFTGIIMIAIFANYLDLLPSSGMISSATRRSLGQDPSLLQIFSTSDFWYHYLLPFFTIMFRYTYFPSLIMRTSITETMGQDFMYYHRMKGLSRLRENRHIMKHSMLPVITLYPVSMTRAIGGMVLVEVVFNWPGIGNLLVESVIARDFPVIQFVFFIVAIWVVLGNYAVDIFYGFIDPRVALDGDGE